MCFPHSSALYFRQCKKLLQPASLIALERSFEPLARRLEISRLSIQKMSWFLIISVESFWTKSFLWFVILAWCLESLSLAFELFLLFLTFLENCLDWYLSLERLFLRN